MQEQPSLTKRRKFLEKVDLTEFIAFEECQCLNEKKEHSFINIFKKPKEHVIVLDSDLIEKENTTIRNKEEKEKEKEEKEEKVDNDDDDDKNNNEKNYLESNCDEQLLLYIKFNQVVRIHYINLEARTDGTAPKTIRLYVNLPHLSFQDLDDQPATQILEFCEKDLISQESVALHFVKFQKVTSLTLFVENNMGETETTIIKRLRLIGDAYSKLVIDLTL